MPTVGELGLDTGGNGEVRVVAWDFKHTVEIQNGGTLLSSPAPVIQQSSSPGQPALTFGVPSLSGTQVVATVTVAGGAPGVTVPTVCRAWINLGAQIVQCLCYGDIVLIGPE